MGVTSCRSGSKHPPLTVFILKLANAEIEPYRFELQRAKRELFRTRLFDYIQCWRMLRGFEENHDITSCSIFYCCVTSYIHENQDHFNSQFYDLFKYYGKPMRLCCVWNVGKERKKTKMTATCIKHVAVALTCFAQDKLRLKHSN